ncbi:uncharacterized protein [Anabrus simplex]
MEGPLLSGLDAALHELGMLSSVTDSRRDYLKEQMKRKCCINRQALNVLQMNTRFVTGVVIGHRKCPSYRYKPYNSPYAREERARTKSENSSDVEVDWFCGSSVPQSVIASNTENTSLYKSRSLEDVKVNAGDETDDRPTREVESVSDKIQHLQVSE